MTIVAKSNVIFRYATLEATNASSENMKITQELITLACYLAGEFENRQQAMESPTWYVSLRLWQIPVNVALFPEPSLVLFAEQANILNIDRPYRQRIMQLRHSQQNPQAIEIQYYMPKDRDTICGAVRLPNSSDSLKQRNWNCFQAAP